MSVEIVLVVDIFVLHVVEVLVSHVVVEVSVLAVVEIVVSTTSFNAFVRVAARF